MRGALHAFPNRGSFGRVHCPRIRTFIPGSLRCFHRSKSRTRRSEPNTLAAPKKLSTSTTTACALLMNDSTPRSASKARPRARGGSSTSSNNGAAAKSPVRTLKWLRRLTPAYAPDTLTTISARDWSAPLRHGRKISRKPERRSTQKEPWAAFTRRANSREAASPVELSRQPERDTIGFDLFEKFRAAVRRLAEQAR